MALVHKINEYFENVILFYTGYFHTLFCMGKGGGGRGKKLGVIKSSTLRKLSLHIVYIFEMALSLHIVYIFEMAWSFFNPVFLTL